MPNSLSWQVIASVGTRVAIGAYPLVFIAAFGWVHGKVAFDAAAAAINWAAYLNVFLLSGFALVPPAVARLRADPSRAQPHAQALADHIALARWLLGAAAFAALLLWGMIDRAFPALSDAAEGRLAIWYPLFALLGIAQIPLTLWLGVAQATLNHWLAFGWLAGSRTASALAVVASGWAGLSATATIGVAVAIVVLAQIAFAKTARAAVLALDSGLPSLKGRVRNVLQANASAGLIALIGTVVTIVPVTLVGHVRPAEVGTAHVIVALSNAFGAFVVAAFLPLSLTLADQAASARTPKPYCRRVATAVAALTWLTIAFGWLLYALCGAAAWRCGAGLFVVGTLVILGSGLRLAALGVYHVALFRGRPHVALLSATCEAAIVLGTMATLLEAMHLAALGVAFALGGAARAGVALTIELRVLTAEDR